MQPQLSERQLTDFIRSDRQIGKQLQLRPSCR